MSHQIDGGSMTERVRAVLENDNRIARIEGMAALRDAAPIQALDALISLLSAPEEKIRGRAGSALSLFHQVAERRADVLADHLQQSEDPAVRVCCVVVLMFVDTAVVRQAFLAALADPYDKVVQIACVQVGHCCGEAGTVALMELLDHPGWRVRLEACKALILQRKADGRVVAALEAMRLEPEAAAYDAEIDEFDRIEQESGEEFPLGEMWGNLDSILTKAREVASRLANG